MASYIVGGLLLSPYRHDRFSEQIEADSVDEAAEIAETRHPSLLILYVTLIPTEE